MPLQITDYSNIDEELRTTASEWFDLKYGPNMQAFSKGLPCDAEGLKKEAERNAKDCGRTENQDDIPKILAIAAFASKALSDDALATIQTRQQGRALDRLRNAIRGCLDHGVEVQAIRTCLQSEIAPRDVATARPGEGEPPGDAQGDATAATG